MGSSQSKDTHWCWEKVELSRDPSRCQYQLNNVAQQIQKTLKKNRSIPRISNQNSVFGFNSQCSHNTFLSNIQSAALERSNAAKNEPHRFIQRPNQSQTTHTQHPSQLTKKNESETQNSKQLSQKGSGNNRKGSQNGSVSNMQPKPSNRFHSPCQLPSFKQLRSISIDASGANTCRNHPTINSKCDHNALSASKGFMTSNVDQRKRRRGKSIFQFNSIPNPPASSQHRRPHLLNNHDQLSNSVADSDRQTIELQNGDVFEGWVAYSGQFQGEGTYTMANGSVYRGVFREGKAHGLGIYHGADGFHYQGQWIDNAPHGYGKAIYHDRSTYAGYFKRGKRHGKGFFTQGNTSYSGDFVEDRMQGYGVYLSKGGEIYEGQWMNDMKHGKGLHKMANGEMYEGEFEYDLKHGYGVLRYSNQSYYAGFWSNGNMDNRRRKADTRPFQVHTLHKHRKVL